MTIPVRRIRESWIGGVPPALLLVLVVAVASGVMIAGASSGAPATHDLWLFSRMHLRIYEPIIRRWNETHDLRVSPVLLSIPAIERRMLGGFLGEVPTADLLEVERRNASRAFAGPVDTVGFVDLTDRLRREGLLDRLNPPSLSPWTSRGRVFGLPHDVHPVMLGYRADIVEAAGIDVSRIETWDDFERELAPLVSDENGDGEPDRYLIAFWPAPAHIDQLEVLLLQAGGGLFDEQDRLRIATEANARVLARLVAWTSGPTRIAADVPEFSAAGNRLKLDGYVVAFLMPDWLTNIYRHEMPQLGGKLKLMPLPAWSPGGRRTSVWGGTMLGISRTAEDFEGLWEFARHLYLSEELAVALYEEGDIITPVVEHWTNPMYDRPDPYFGDQAKGRMYIDLAADVPRRTSSPYNTEALRRVHNALISLHAWAESHAETDPSAIEAEAMRRLREVERQMRDVMERNRFLDEPS